jgi:hypothetical protein
VGLGPRIGFTSHSQSIFSRSPLSKEERTYDSLYLARAPQGRDLSDGIEEVAPQERGTVQEIIEKVLEHAPQKGDLPDTVQALIAELQDSIERRNIERRRDGALPDPENPSFRSPEVIIGYLSGEMADYVGSKFNDAPFNEAFRDTLRAELKGGIEAALKAGLGELSRGYVGFFVDNKYLSEATGEAITRYTKAFYASYESAAKYARTWYGKVFVGIGIAAINTIYPSILANQVEVGAFLGGSTGSIVASFILDKLTFPANAILQTLAGQGLTISTSAGINKLFEAYNVTGV